MSIDYGTYIGPYIRCEVGQIERVEIKRGCLSPSCANHSYYASGGSFCNLCGSPVGSVQIAKIDDAVDDWDVREHLQDRLTTPSGDGYYTWKKENHAHLWMPNIDSPGHHLDTQEDFNLIEITDIDTTQFTLQFSDDIAYLREVYGNASIHWGVIQDYS